MSYTSLLIETCTIQRFTEGAKDDYGNPALTWSDNLTDEPCRLVTLQGLRGGREIKVGAELVIASYNLFLGDVDITEQDRVVLNSLTYEVLLVQNYQDGAGDHHKQCWLRISR